MIIEECTDSAMVVAHCRVPGHRKQDFGVRSTCFSLHTAVANETHNTEQFISFPTVPGTMLSCLQKSAYVLLQRKVIKIPLLACFTQKPATILSCTQEKWSVVSWCVLLTTTSSNSFSQWHPLKILGCCSSTPPMSGHYLKEQSWRYCLLCMLQTSSGTSITISRTRRRKVQSKSESGFVFSPPF